MSRGIDFVDDEDPGGQDEELPQQPSPTWRPRLGGFLRRRYGLPVVVVVLVLAFLVGRAVLGRQPDATPMVSPGSSVAVNPSTGRVIANLPLRTGPDPRRCPGLRCYTSPSVPASVRAAVRAVLPTAQFTAVETIRLVDRADGDPLWFREVVARAGTATLTLQVQAHAAGDTRDGGAKDDGAQSVTYQYAELQQWFVKARVVNRSGSGDVFDQLTALVTDQRLLTS